MRLLLLVAGAARSGTSTAAGTLHHLGLDVPGPYLESNESNPRGFFESRWAVRFHNRLLDGAGLSRADARPVSYERAQAALDQRAAHRLDNFLRSHDDLEQLVVKDPRTVWFQRAWAEAAARAGREIRFLSMVRHPAEVVRSRNTYYTDVTCDEESERQSTLNLMRWVNSLLISERHTRDDVRAYVLYADLLADWREQMARVGDTLGLRYDPALDVRPHPVDGFVEPSLRRHDASWDRLPLNDDLRAIAQQVWDCHRALAADDDSDAVRADLDSAGRRYERLVTAARMLDQEEVQEAARTGRAAGAAEARRDVRPVEDLPTRELVRLVRQRAAVRARRTLPGRSGVRSQQEDKHR